VEDFTTPQQGRNGPTTQGPGNKARRCWTTILEKSLGAVAKSGSAPADRCVFLFGRKRSKRPGLCFMDSPGFDPLLLSPRQIRRRGAKTLIDFTTGARIGVCYMPHAGSRSRPIPKCIHRMYGRHGRELRRYSFSEGVSLTDKGRDISNCSIALASGRAHKKAKAWLWRRGNFVPWQIGRSDVSAAAPKRDGTKKSLGGAL